MNAQGLASLGRGGDDQIGHLTTGEKVLPLPVAQDPSVQRVINQSFAKHGLNADQYTVGHADNSINPLTDYPEYGLGKFFKKVGKAFRKIAQPVLTAVGFIYGGPKGAAIGSSIGGGIRRGKFDVKDAVKDAAGAYAITSVGQGMGLKGGQFGTTWSQQGIGALKNIVPGTQNSMWGWGATPTTDGGIGGFFQNLGARGASMLPGGGGADAIAGTPAANLFGKEGAWSNLNMLQKAGIMGIGGLAASKAGLFDQPPLQGRPAGVGELNEQQQQYLTGGLRPATTMPGVGGSSSGNLMGYQGRAGIGSMSNPQQDLLDYLEEQKRKYLMQFPQFQTGRAYGYNEGGPVANPVAYLDSNHRTSGFDLPPTPKERLNNLMYSIENRAINDINPYSYFIDRGLDTASKMQIGDQQIHPGLLSLIGGANNAVNRVVRGTVGTLIPGGRRPIKDLRERRKARQAQKQAEIEENIKDLTNPGVRDMYEGGPAKVTEDGVPIDNIPAMLTEDEHVLTRDAIRGLGNGDIERGHQIAKEINDSAEIQEQLQNQILQRKYFMQFPQFNRGVA
tara:strand:- start:628 stop:2313 length:1686 start_codon:yes stop_codon:yes gene_type:complete